MIHVCSDRWNMRSRHKRTTDCVALVDIPGLVLLLDHTELELVFVRHLMSCSCAVECTGTRSVVFARTRWTADDLLLLACTASTHALCAKQCQDACMNSSRYIREPYVVVVTSETVKAKVNSIYYIVFQFGRLCTCWHAQLHFTCGSVWYAADAYAKFMHESQT